LVFLCCHSLELYYSRHSKRGACHKMYYRKYTRSVKCPASNLTGSLKLELKSSMCHDSPRELEFSYSFLCCCLVSNSEEIPCHKFARDAVSCSGAPGVRDPSCGFYSRQTDGGLSPLVTASASHGQTVSGGIVLAVICWSPCAQRQCYPTGRCVYRPSVTS